METFPKPDSGPEEKALAIEAKIKLLKEEEAGFFRRAENSRGGLMLHGAEEKRLVDIGEQTEALERETKVLRIEGLKDRKVISVKIDGRYITLTFDEGRPLKINHAVIDPDTGEGVPLVNVKFEPPSDAVEQ